MKYLALGLGIVCTLLLWRISVLNYKLADMTKEKVRFEELYNLSLKADKSTSKLTKDTYDLVTKEQKNKIERDKIIDKIEIINHKPEDLVHDKNIQDVIIRLNRPL